MILQKYSRADSDFKMGEITAYDPPLVCPHCGKKIFSVQTKAFGNSLDVYQPGEIVLGNTVHHGIVEDQGYCDSCTSKKKSSFFPVFIIIWHDVFAGLRQDKDEAFKILEGIDRLQLLEWLEKYQIERKECERQFRNFYNTLHSLQEYLSAPDKEEFLSSHRLFQFNNVIKHIHSEDPLESVLQEYKDNIPTTDADM